MMSEQGKTETDKEVKETEKRTYLTIRKELYQLLERRDSLQQELAKTAAKSQELYSEHFYVFMEQLDQILKEKTANSGDADDTLVTIPICMIEDALMYLRGWQAGKRAPYERSTGTDDDIPF